MKRVLMGLLALVVLAVVGVLGAAAMQPDQVHIERKLAMAATPADVFPYLNDLKKFVEWSPWQDRDPTQTMEFSEPSFGTGAWYAWKGNDQVGEGKMTITAVEPGRKVDLDLEFIAPWQSKATVDYTLTPRPEGVEVVWGYDEQPAFTGKLFMMFMDMDAMLGADFEKGLASLKVKAEAAAAERVEAEARAAEEAARLAAELAAPVDAVTVDKVEMGGRKGSKMSKVPRKP